MLPGLHMQGGHRADRRSSRQRLKNGYDQHKQTEKGNQHLSVYGQKLWAEQKITLRCEKSLCRK